MVQLLSLTINKIFVFLIKIYRKYFSNRINRKCIYNKTCSKYALDLLKSSRKFHFLKIYKRYKSCRVKEIITSENEWYIINGLNEKMYPSEINLFTKNNIKKIIQGR